MSNEKLGAFVDGLTAKLFEKEELRLASEVDRLCQMNNEAYGYDTQGFMHSGKVYLPSQLKGQEKAHRHKKPIHSSLTTQINSFLWDARQVRNDQALIQRNLIDLMTPCQAATQDYRDALPDCLADLVDWAGSRPRRTRPEAYTIINDELIYQRYLKARNKIDLYSATRLIY